MGLTANVIPVSGVNRTSQIVTSVIPAGEFLSIFQAGARFYLIVSTGVLKIKPNNGAENEYVQGTGLAPEENNYFANIQIKNDTPNSIVFQIFVGFGSYIDNRLIVYDPSVFQITFPTSPITSTSNEILIPDRSGTAIVGWNGVSYLALNRIAIYISNLDTGLVYSLQALAGTIQPLALALSVQPASNIVFPSNGDFRIKIPSGNINAIVSEIYNAILPS